MDEVNTSGVVSNVDGKTPRYEPESPWKIWGLHEVWIGPSVPGEDRYVPKIRDYVIDPDTYTTYIVDFLDPVSLIPTLREIRPSFTAGLIAEVDMLLGPSNDTYRMYIDKSTIPHTVAIDSRLKINGSMSSYSKVYRGNDLGGAGEVLSQVYDSSGNFVSTSVPLELVAIDSHTNYFIKTIRTFKTIKDLEDGELVTVVVYSDNGHVITKRQLLVENTAFIRSTNVSTKYVSHISLESPFLSPVNDRLIEFPLNIPLNALNLIGVVNYSDGTTLKLPVDNSKFRMLGINQYVSSIIGQELELVLSYALSAGEISYAGSGGNHITEPYTLRTINPNLSYSVKLFAYPRWINDAIGYQVNWTLLNLDRNIHFDVTDKVSYNPATGPFNPKGYGLLQRKSISVNLKNVSGAFKNFTHTQLVDITLFGAPSTSATSWTVAHEAAVNDVVYGTDLSAKRISQFVLNIQSAIPTYEVWLQRMYRDTFPLVNNATETEPLLPTHIRIAYSNSVSEITVAQWKDDITVGDTVNIYSNVSLTFIRKTGQQVAYLAEAALVIKP